MAIWNLPESRKLEHQMLDKLSLAPWPWLHRNLDTNAAALLRPLLEDVVSNESCLEIRRATNQPSELVFAIRLDDQRAALWQTNLAAVLESLTGIHPIPAPNNLSGWLLKKHHVPNLIELTRAGDWTLVGAAEDHNGLLNEFQSNIQHSQAPLPAEDTTNWLEADVDPAPVAAFFSLSARATGGEGRGEVGSKNIPAISHFHLAVTSDGANVLSHGAADFPEPLTLGLQPWNIPTNLIDEKLSSFTLIRGFQPLLASSPVWTNLQIGPPPDQACLWGGWGIPAQSYFTAPLPDASNEVDRLADWALQNQVHWFATNGLARFERAKTFNGLDWKGLPYMSPFLCSLATNGQNFIYGGGFPASAQTQPLTLAGAQAALGQTNLVYHDWEMTGPRTEQWIFMSQFARLIFHKAQLPPNSTGLLWLQALPPKLGLSVTDIAQTGPDELSFTRKSSIGFTAIELNLLADWLESPQFPCGLHTFLAPASSQF